MICPKCGSNSTKKNGIRLRKIGEAQEGYCNSCQKYFSFPIHSDVSEELLGVIEPGEILKLSYKKPIRLHGATDVHHGANEHHEKKFNELIEEVDADPNAIWFLNGDNIEFIPPNYYISQRGQHMEPDEQHLSFVKRIEKIADKLIFVRGGNHDYLRSVSLLGFDVSQLLADRLNVPYYRLPGYTRIDINDSQWYLVTGHGKSGAKNGDLELDKMAAVYSEGDVFFLGHNHQLYAKPIDSLRIVDDKEKLHRRWYCRGGSFLNYADYARYSFFPMIRTGWVTMEFTEKEINSWTN
jgi:predicted phosphodiesterase